MLLFGADKRKGDEPKNSLRFRISISLLLTLALIGYVSYEIYLIYIDGQDGFSVRTTIYTRETYSVPDVVFCSDTNPEMTYKCDTLLADGTRIPGGCSSLLSPTSTKYEIVKSIFDYCYSFRANQQLIFDQWNDNYPGVQSIQFNISVPAGQAPPNRLKVQLFDPATNFYASNKIIGEFEDSVEIQAARVQNRYILMNGTQISVLYSASIHQQLSKKDPVAVFGFAPSSWSDQHFLSSSADKTILANQQDMYGIVSIQPATYNTIIQQDQRRYTILTALGLLGGAYGAFASLFFFMFGEKQINPVGIVSRIWILSQKQTSYDPNSLPMQQRPGLLGSQETQSGPAGKSGEAQYSRSQNVNFDELSLEQRVNALERVLKDYVVDLDQIGHNTLGQY